MKKKASNGYYPIALQLKGRQCLIVGGGKVAERKLKGLLDAGADRIRLISPETTEYVQTMSEACAIEWEARSFEKNDMEMAWLVIAATNDPELNALIAAEAETRGMLSNIANDAGKGSFIIPSVVRRGDLLIAVTASGASPALAKALRQELEDRYGERYSIALEKLKELRRLVIERVGEREKKERILSLAADEALDEAIAGKSAQEWMDSLIERIKGRKFT